MAGPEPTIMSKYRHLLDTAPDAIVVVRRDGRIALVNRQTETLFGWPREELVGQPLDMLVPQRFRATHHLHIERYFAAPSMRPMGSGMPLSGIRRDGSELPIEVSLSPVETEDGVLVSAAIRDMTERRRMETELRVNAERLSSAIEIMQDAFALFDGKDRLILCNSAYRGLIAESVPGVLVGRTLTEIFELWSKTFATDTATPPVPAWKAWLVDKAMAREAFGVQTTDGRSYRVSNARTLEGGTAQTLWNLTDAMQREEELRVARGAAEEGSRAKSDFLASMSHELRTPMNAILGFAQLLQRDRKEPPTIRQLERIDHILRGGEHLLRLIDDVLDLARIEAGGVSVSIEPISLPEVIAEAVAALTSAAARAGVRIDVQPSEGVLPLVAADRTRLIQILMNFGSNAVKYNRSGGAVVFAATLMGDTVRVSVVDTGMGIPLEKHAVLFQPFQRAGQETGPIEGTGIGLAITRRLAALTGATVGFRSVPGQGSTFWVDVPVKEGLVGSSGTEHGDAEQRAELAPRQVVLYVEDNPANVIFMRDLLESFGELILLTAGSAEQGVEMARARVPDVIIMDINLPGMSGFDALKILRRLPETKDVPVIALTAAASVRDRVLGEQAGFHRYLTKPIKVDELETCLAGLLSKT